MKDPKEQGRQERGELGELHVCTRPKTDGETRGKRGV